MGAKRPSSGKRVHFLRQRGSRASGDIRAGSKLRHLEFSGVSPKA